MEGIIANFRKSMHVQKGNHMVVYIEGIANKEKAGSLVGKSVVWKSPAGKEIKGRIAGAHGNKGAVRIIFDKGMPGQSIGEKVSIG